MSVVVLRCPNCGTTKATPGECEACHEAEVAYYCTNHSPGLWLASPRCPECGAQFGIPAVRPAPSGSETVAVRPQKERRESELRGSARSSSTIVGKGAPPRDDMEEEIRRRAAIRKAVLTRLPELLRPRRDKSGSDEIYVPEAAHAGMALGGCFVRGILLGIFLLIALVFGALMLGGSLLHGFGIVIL